MKSRNFKKSRTKLGGYYSEARQVGEPLEHDAISKLARKRNVRLQRDSLFCDARKQIRQSRNGRIPSICGNQHAAVNFIALAGPEFPVATFSFQLGQCYSIMHFGA